MWEVQRCGERLGALRFRFLRDPAHDVGADFLERAYRRRFVLFRAEQDDVPPHGRSLRVATAAMPRPVSENRDSRERPARLR